MCLLDTGRGTDPAGTSSRPFPGYGTSHINTDVFMFGEVEDRCATLKPRSQRLSTPPRQGRSFEPFAFL